MDRIICDICGSEYDATAERCPTCNYPRQGNEAVAAAAGEIVRTKVRGGRFSNKNVRKRRKARGRAVQAQPRKQSDRGLWITIIILLIAIVLVSAYIVLRFWNGRNDFVGPEQTKPALTAPAETTVACGTLTLDTTVVELDAAEQQVQLAVKALPENTTDPIFYASADPAVAEVSADGVVTAIGTGQTVITITCGNQTAQCSVICRLPEETTQPVETTEATEPAALKLSHEDVTFSQPGEMFTTQVMLGDTYLARSSVTWTSSSPDVAAVDNGVVTAVGGGTAVITAEYQGRKATCIVRCQFQNTGWRASSTDVTLRVGESFRLSVISDSGESADVIWTMSIDGVVSMEGSTITGRAPGRVTLSTEIDGATLKCIVRVK